MDIVYEQEELTEDLRRCFNISTNHGNLDVVYLGPGGVCVVLDRPVGDVRGLFYELRSYLSISRIQIYVRGIGRYDFLSGQYSFCQEEEAMLRSIAEFLVSEVRVLSSEDIDFLEDHLQRLNVYVSGRYVSESGVEYIRMGDVFKPLSGIDPDRFFLLTLFGGFLGFHRFRLGKIGSGFGYLLTGGLLGLGWLLDVISVLTGNVYDSKKRLVRKLSSLKRVFWIPLGAVACLVYLFLYFRTLLGIPFFNMVALEQILNNNPDLINLLKELTFE